MTFICGSPAEDYEEQAFREALKDSDDFSDRFVGQVMDVLPKEGEPDWTWDDQRRAFAALADRVEEWHGFPIPIPELPLALHERHPLRAFYATYDTSTNELLGRTCTTEDVDETESIRNQWFSKRLNATVYVVQNKDGIRALKFRKAPNDSMRRLDLTLRTMLACDAWDLDAEAKAVDKLAGMVSGRQLRAYFLTGAFIETSKRSGVMYLFRKLRPTIAMSDSGRGGNLRFLAALCLHPLGYYQESFAGCMVPTDDVIAHLTLMRGDEADFWGKANHHQGHEAEAGL